MSEIKSLSLEEVVKLAEKAGFHIHLGMRGQINWKGKLVDHLMCFAELVKNYDSTKSSSSVESPVSSSTKTIEEISDLKDFNEDMKISYFKISGSKHKAVKG